MFDTMIIKSSVSKRSVRIRLEDEHGDECESLSWNQARISDSDVVNAVTTLCLMCDTAVAEIVRLTDGDVNERYIYGVLLNVLVNQANNPIDPEYIEEVPCEDIFEGMDGGET